MQITDEYDEHIGTIETNDGVFYIVRAGDELRAGGLVTLALWSPIGRILTPIFH